MKSSGLYFLNSTGLRLSARLDSDPVTKPKAYALFAHCFTCSKDLKAVGNICRALTAQQISVLRFDFTGLGESEGEFEDSHFSRNVSDLVDAANYMKENLQPPDLLIGHSLGGAAVLRASAQIPSAQGVVTIAAPSDPEHVTRLLVDSIEEIEKHGEAEIVLAGRTFTITREFLDDLDAHQMKNAIRNLNKALLILHSPVDEIVGIENAAQIFLEAKHPKSFVSLDRADHLLLDEADSSYAGALIAVWSSRYLQRE